MLNVAQNPFNTKLIFSFNNKAKSILQFFFYFNQENGRSKLMKANSDSTNLTSLKYTSEQEMKPEFLEPRVFVRRSDQNRV